jgi:DNA polymerase-3 subunit delta'
MPTPPLYGHEGIRHRLVGAIAAGRLPQALLFEGASGVGKQRLGLWLAQALVCEAGRETTTDSRVVAGEPCGACQHCKLVLSLSHPDVHWFVPLEPSKKSADADKQVELVEEALGEEMAARRAQPLYEPPSGLASHGIAAVRLLLRRLILKPAMGRRKVFLIGDAERLVPQTGAETAANALLKALEEPPADTVFVLTTAAPESLLPTILSRVVRARVARLPDSVVTAFAQHELGVTGQRDLAQRVALADGRIGRLLAGKDGSAHGADAAQRFLTAVEAGPERRYGFALGLPPFQARGGFTEMLDGLLERLRERARAGGETEQVVAAIERVLEARGLAQGNVNPQLMAAVLADDLAGAEGAGEEEGGAA